MLLRIYKALLLTLFVPFAFSRMIWWCTTGQASNSKQRSSSRKQQSVLGRKLSNRCLLLFHCCPVSGDCKRRQTFEQDCLLGFSREFSSDFAAPCGSFHSSLVSFINSCLATALLGWFTVMTDRTISGSETTSCSLCRVTTRVTVISWASFLQVDTFYYKH